MGKSLTYDPYLSLNNAIYPSLNIEVFNKDWKITYNLVVGHFPVRYFVNNTKTNSSHLLILFVSLYRNKLLNVEKGVDEWKIKHFTKQHVF